ncbi:hypothetical protein B0T20DRAFT_453920 [Sordaria brevicollis]|uniref:Uncharacterized protein n=1 Tax=Sordaria brevicollis TaxID=83679 RepID=A0AAE0PDF6_SORBR|nr:hypothetical protein B0T20DRAFT_453920 [Sordaria brevicollis]
MERTFNHQKWDPARKAYPAYWKLWKATIHDRMIISRPPPSPGSGSDDSYLPPPPPPPPRRERRERPPSPVNPYDAAGLGYYEVPATAFFWSSSSSPCSSSSNDLEKPDDSKGEAVTSPHYFTVLPMQDLIIIRPTTWGSHLNEGYWHSFELNFPFGAERYGFPGFCGWKGFALEFDPSWGEKPEFGATWQDRANWRTDGSSKLPEGAIGIFDLIYNAITVFSNLPQIQTIWLIDYRLKPKRGTPSGGLESSQTVYHGGDGSRFVEIYSEFVADGGDHLAEYYTEGIDGENSATGEGSCHWFIEEFEACMFGDLYDSESVDSNYSRYPPHIGLLACLP